MTAAEWMQGRVTADEVREVIDGPDHKELLGLCLLLLSQAKEYHPNTVMTELPGLPCKNKLKSSIGRSRDNN